MFCPWYSLSSATLNELKAIMMDGGGAGLNVWVHRWPLRETELQVSHLFLWIILEEGAIITYLVKPHTWQPIGRTPCGLLSYWVLKVICVFDISAREVAEYLAWLYILVCSAFFTVPLGVPQGSVKLKYQTVPWTFTTVTLAPSLLWTDQEIFQLFLAPS